MYLHELMEGSELILPTIKPPERVRCQSLWYMIYPVRGEVSPPKQMKLRLINALPTINVGDQSLAFNLKAKG